MTEQRGRVRTEPSHKRVRIAFGGDVIVDTDDALYVWEIPYYPQYYVPLGDVADGVLHPSADPDPIAEPRAPPTTTPSAPAIGRHRTRPGATRTARSRRCASGSASTGARWTPGSRRTRRSSSTRATRRRGCRSCPARATSRSPSTGSSSPTRRGRRSCTRPTCRGARTSPSSTCGWTCSCRRPPARCARTRARRATGRSRRRRRARRHRVELSVPVPRVGTDRRADGVLRQPGRRHRRRRAPGTPGAVTPGTP